MLATAAVLGIVCLACTEPDVIGPRATAAPSTFAEVPSIGVVAGFNCQVAVREARLTCERAEIPAPTAATRTALIG